MESMPIPSIQRRPLKGRAVLTFQGMSAGSTTAEQKESYFRSSTIVTNMVSGVMVRLDCKRPWKNKCHLTKLDRSLTLGLYDSQSWLWGTENYHPFRVNHTVD